VFYIPFSSLNLAVFEETASALCISRADMHHTLHLFWDFHFVRSAPFVVLGCAK
jgi:hypothetical protein